MGVRLLKQKRSQLYESHHKKLNTCALCFTISEQKNNPFTYKNNKQTKNAKQSGFDFEMGNKEQKRYTHNYLQRKLLLSKAIKS